ncbi:hypothetical protein JOC95_001474 [Bacillus tianshenii]|uniref:Uncharacterized protein n=1 Tax=Sutcliffiella tianshenii TaxID=1463404 RepID=A0ABS2NYX0_9BACI|nr:hypothetical protein [Bacillus tianshenii]
MPSVKNKVMLTTIAKKKLLIYLDMGSFCY